MEIFWLDTEEGAKIPLLMLKPTLTIDTLNTNGKSLTERIALARDWFNATNDELWRFMTDLSIANVVYENGRQLTLKEKGPYNNPVIVVGNKEKDKVKHEDYHSYTWDQGVVFIPKNEYNGPDYIWKEGWVNYLFIYTDIYSEMCMYGKPEEVPRYYRPYRVGVLVRDTTGRVKPVTFELSNSDTISDSERFQVAVSTDYYDGVYISRGWAEHSDEFWQAQKGVEPQKPKGGGIVDIRDRFSPRTAASSLGIYPITTEQLTNFSFDMWTTNFLEKFIMNLYGKPIDSLISLRWYYGILEEIKRSEKDAYLTMGNVAFRGALGGLAGSEIVTKPAISEYIMFSCGEVLVERHFNNFLDMSPFTKLQIFIPYIGFVSLDATEFMGKLMRLDYNINIITGAAVAYIYVKVSDNNWRIAMQIPCTVGIDIPLSFNARESIASRMATGMLKTAGVGLGAVTAIATHNAAGAVAGVVGSMAQNVVENSFNPPMVQDYQVNRSGGMDSETGSLGYLQPFLLITRPITQAPEDYNELVGNPDFRSGKISSFKGYIKVGTIKNKDANVNKSIPRPAMNEIEQLLRGGVYIE